MAIGTDDTPERARTVDWRCEARENPVLLQTIMGPGAREGWKHFIDCGVVDVYFIDLLSRPLWSAIFVLTAPLAAVRLLKRDDFLVLTDVPQRQEVIDLADLQFPQIERSLPQMVVEFYGPTKLVNVVALGPPTVRADPWNVRGRSLQTAHDGATLEEDVAVVLARLFPSQCILVNPMNAKGADELCDVLVVTDEDVLVVQAKKRIHSCVDSAKASSVAVARSEKKAREGMRQLIGSFRALSSDHVDLKLTDARLQSRLQIIQATFTLPYQLIDGIVRISMAGKRLHFLAVLNEAYPSSFVTLSEEIFSAMDRVRSPLFLCDLDDLLSFVLDSATAAAFFTAFDAHALRCRRDRQMLRMRFKPAA